MCVLNFILLSYAELSQNTLHRVTTNNCFHSRCKSELLSFPNYCTAHIFQIVSLYGRRYAVRTQAYGQFRHHYHTTRLAFLYLDHCYIALRTRSEIRHQSRYSKRFTLDISSRKPSSFSVSCTTVVLRCALSIILTVKFSLKRWTRTPVRPSSIRPYSTERKSWSAWSKIRCQTSVKNPKTVSILFV